MSIKDSVPPVSKSGFLLGAALALAAVALKIVFLKEMDEKNQVKGVGDEAISSVG